MLLSVTIAAACVVPLLAAETGAAGAANQSSAARTAAAARVTTPGNPFAKLRWGNYDGYLDEAFPPYRSARGATRTALGKIALRPRMRYFGAWYRTPYIYRTLREYIQNSQHGDRNKLVQMAIFRLLPGEGSVRKHVMNRAEQSDYVRWVNNAARAIGSTPVVMVLQPDLPVWENSPHHSTVPSRMTAYAARKFGALPRTRVYIDAGTVGWLAYGHAVRMLKRSGIQYADGFALGATHYDSVTSNLRYGRTLSNALAGAHVRGKRFVINTADNGRPFTQKWFRARYPHGNFDNAPVCRTRSQLRCVSLGIPPTARTADPRWRLSRYDAAIARAYCDAYLWFGRPWLTNQASPFDRKRAIQLGRVSRY